MTTDLVLGLVVELVGQPGEVVADLLAHGDLNLLALAAPRTRLAWSRDPVAGAGANGSDHQLHWSRWTSFLLRHRHNTS